MRTAALRATAAQLALEVTEAVKCPRCNRWGIARERCKCGVVVAPPVPYELLANAPTWSGTPGSWT